MFLISTLPDIGKRCILYKDEAICVVPSATFGIFTTHIIRLSVTIIKSYSIISVQLNKS